MQSQKKSKYHRAPLINPENSSGAEQCIGHARYLHDIRPSRGRDRNHIELYTSRFSPMASNRIETIHHFSEHSRKLNYGNSERSGASALRPRQCGQNSIKNNVEYDDISISDTSSARSSSKTPQHRYIEQSTETEFASKQTGTELRLISRVGELDDSINRHKQVSCARAITRSNSQQLQQYSKSPLLNQSLPASPRPSRNLLRGRTRSPSLSPQTGPPSSSGRKDQGLRIVSEASSSVHDQQDEDIQQLLIGTASDLYCLDHEYGGTHDVGFTKVASEVDEISDIPGLTLSSSPRSPKPSKVTETSASLSSSKKRRNFKAKLAKIFVRDEQACDGDGEQIQVKHWTDDY